MMIDSMEYWIDKSDLKTMFMENPDPKWVAVANVASSLSFLRFCVLTLVITTAKKERFGKVG